MLAGPWFFSNSDNDKQYENPCYRYNMQFRFKLKCCFLSVCIETSSCNGFAIKNLKRVIQYLIRKYSLQWILQNVKITDALLFDLLPASVCFCSPSPTQIDTLYPLKTRLNNY